MKKILLATACILSLATSANAASSDDANWPYWYLGLNAGGVVSATADYDAPGVSGDYDPAATFAYSASIGYAPGPVRFEAEFGAADHDIEQGTSTGNIRTYRVMANAIYDFGTDGFSPYLGAGIGAIKADVSPSNPTGINGGDTTGAYQLLAGVSFGEVAPNVNLNIGYRYIATFDEVEVGTTKIDYDAHQAEAGLRFRF